MSVHIEITAYSQELWKKEGMDEKTPFPYQQDEKK